MLLSLKYLSTLSLTVLWNRLGGGGGRGKGVIGHHPLTYPGLGKTGISLLTSSPT